jgi:mannose-1-phosphate guanylyltransferase
MIIENLSVLLVGIDTAIILAGGYATRLRPLTLTRPKALLPILGKPLLDWILSNLRSAGIKRVYVSVRYMSNMIKERYNDGSDYGLKIEYVEEISPLGDGGPIPLIVEKFSINEPFLVVYGDVFSDVSLESFIKFHVERGATASIVLTPVDNPSRYGVAQVGADGRVVKFVEKPQGQPPSNLVNAGFYIFSPELMKYFPAKKPSKLAVDVLPKLVEDGLLSAYIHEGLWLDIGVPKDYLKANLSALKYLMPEGFISPTSEIGDNVEIIKPVFIDENAKIGDNSVIGPYALIGKATIVGSNARIVNSLLLDNVVTESACYLKGAIVGAGSHIGRWVRISPGVVLGDEVRVYDEVFITEDVTILPHKELSDDIIEEGKVIL